MVDELLSLLLTTIWGRRLGLTAAVVLLLFILFTLIDMPISWHSDIKLTQAAVSITPVQTDTQLSKSITAIPEKHLFGKYGMIEQSALLPVTSLQIHLVGVIKATPEKLSRVIISESSQPGKVYQVGDSLPSSGVKIYAITSEGVVLDNSGRLEKLPLQRVPLEFQGMPKPLLGE